MGARAAQDFITRLTHLLLEGGEEAGSDAHAELVGLVEANRWTVLAMATHDSRKLMGMTMKVKSLSVGKAGPPPPGHHERVLARSCLPRYRRAPGRSRAPAALWVVRAAQALDCLGRRALGVCALAAGCWPAYWLCCRPGLEEGRTLPRCRLGREGVGQGGQAGSVHRARPASDARVPAAQGARNVALRARRARRAQDTLGLSMEQKQRLVDARRALITRVEGVVSERRRAGRTRPRPRPARADGLAAPPCHAGREHEPSANTISGPCELGCWRRDRPFAEAP